MAKCPKCGSDRFKYELRSGGTSSESTYYRTRKGTGWIIPAGRKSRSSNRKQMSVGICPDCGYIEKGKSTGNSIGCLPLIIGIFFIMAVFNMITGDRSSSSAESSNEQEETAIWASSITPIDEFEYYLDGDYVFLKDYKGSEKKVWVGSEYTINEKIYKVGDNIEALFALGNVSSVILPEGIKSMENNTFNSCGVEYFYLPGLLREAGSFYSYFHDVKQIYYGGSKEDWQNLTDNADRADIDAVEIIYDAKIEDLVSEVENNS